MFWLPCFGGVFFETMVPHDRNATPAANRQLLLLQRQDACVGAVRCRERVCCSLLVFVRFVRLLRYGGGIFCACAERRRRCYFGLATAAVLNLIAPTIVAAKRRNKVSAYPASPACAGKYRLPSYFYIILRVHDTASEWDNALGVMQGHDVLMKDMMKDSKIDRAANRDCHC